MQQKQIELKEKALTALSSDSSSLSQKQTDPDLDSSANSNKKPITEINEEEACKYGMYMPGFQMLSKHLIKPLMFATEKVFQKYSTPPAKPREDFVTTDFDQSGTSNEV